MSEHAILAPSSAPAWGVCSGYVCANADAPDNSTPESRAGDAAHWVAAECLNNWRSAERGLHLFCHEWVGQVDPAGTVIDETMAEGAQVLVDDVIKTAQQYGGLRSLLVEHRVQMPQIHEQNWGTLDVAMVLPESALIIIWDYKHGHREVSAPGNLQMIDYIAGLCNEYQIDGPADQFYTVDMRIVQPFCYHATDRQDRWVGKLSELRGYFNQLSVKAHEALTNPRLTSGLYCRDCVKVGTCPTARKSTYALIDYVDEPYRFDVMSGPALTAERQIIQRGLKAAKARLEAIEDELQSRIKSGDTSCGYTVETKEGRLKWAVEPEMASAFAKQFGANIEKLDVLTPTQAADRVDPSMRAAFKHAIKTVTARPAGGTQLVAVENSRTARAFTKKDEEH